jgi:hypothetical protein
MRIRGFSLVLLSTILLATAGCSSEEAPCLREDGAVFVGKVVETMEANTYTYVRVECRGESRWAAGPRTAVQIGDELAIPTEMVMFDFHSESLDRGFEEIYFVTELAPPEEKSTTPQAAMNPHGGDEPTAEHGAPRPAKQSDLSGIEVPEGGLRIAQLWAKRAELAGQEVLVRGRVTKYNGGILDRNWIHLQDGSGNEEDGTHDLAVTTQMTSAVGEEITVRGTVAVDQDFGSGYRYSLLLEKAKIE